MLPQLEPVELSESAGTYRSALRAVARGLWSGVIDYDQFWDNFSSAIRSGLTAAWNAGAKKGGIKPEELTLDEQTELQNIIFSQFGHIAKLASWIEQNNKASGSKLGAVLSRIELWVQAYPSTFDKAYAMAAGDQKAKWIYGDTDHCSTCQTLHGKVKRMSFWLTHVMPRNPPNSKLECKGFRCQCRLEPTNEPISRGPLPMGL